MIICYTNNMILTLLGNTPSKKNAKQISINRRTGARFIRTSDKAKSWELMAVTELRKQFQGYVVTNYPITVTITFYYDNKRRHDIDNSASTVLDAMSLAGIIEDDNVNFVNQLVLKYGGLDKEDPRCEIELYN